MSLRDKIRTNIKKNSTEPPIVVDLEYTDMGAAEYLQWLEWFREESRKATMMVM